MTFDAIRTLINEAESAQALADQNVEDQVEALRVLQAEYDAYKLSVEAAPPGNVRDLLEPGKYQVTAATTGVRPEQKLAITDTHKPVTGGVYRNLDIRNTVQPVGIGHAHYFDCIFRGPVLRPSGTTGLFSAVRLHLRGFEFTDCTWRPQNPDYRWVGIQGYGFRLRRCDLSGAADPVQVFNANNGLAPDGMTWLRDWVIDVDIRQCLLHDQAFFAKAADKVPTTSLRWGGGETSPDGSHSDDIQWQGGGGLIVKHSVLTGLLGPEWRPNNKGGIQGNAAIMIAPDVGRIYGADITDNTLGGGAVTVNIADKPAKGRVIRHVGTIKGNRMLGGMTYPPHDFKLSSSTSQNPGGIQGDFGVGTASANKRTDGSLAVIKRVTVA